MEKARPRTRQVVQRFLGGRGISWMVFEWLAPRYQMGAVQAQTFIEECIRREFDRLHRLVKARPSRRSR